MGKSFKEFAEETDKTTNEEFGDVVLSEPLMQTIDQLEKQLRKQFGPGCSYSINGPQGERIAANNRRQKRIRPRLS